MNIEKLKANVAARNAANDVANRTYEQVLAALMPFQGTKAIRADCTLVKRVYDAMPELRYEHTWPEPTVTAWIDASRYSIGFNVKACAPLGECTCVYQATYTTVARLDDEGRISRFEEHPNYRTDYSADELQLLHTEWKRLQAEADKAKSVMYPFEQGDF